MKYIKLIFIIICFYINYQSISSLGNQVSINEALVAIVIGEKVQLTTLFYNETLPLLKNLKKLEISNQEHPFPDKFNIPDKLSGVQFNSIFVPLSSIWF
ncbi:hypothetical protein DDB_G0272907 [Dictyostelium discoideum AX4]|uniref:Uncharacterized protein n=1 Tax=Dictyostelium discoideum TaxID=44689 RepID=Q556N2_DICDI|nr:hypothetical protein DDB_G0273929 [Dictyostelium discoideum AX4]XP_645091.1 hypothetical protein DDB_G0272907 [Dictyostelium discoideum AX4]EAL70398.1 hypothetical protein DDB_G0273929 [Dictyostelium discoideum AX4]EAL71091.1 hypothetical protein DDB_G0272907 [Dictyostelium discoideum AX4]|eukprot:XP_644323.1 hypothetical protein DDB_G0273929 [Dictyostelium discoideum AX4]